MRANGSNGFLERCQSLKDVALGISEQDEVVRDLKKQLISKSELQGGAQKHNGRVSSPTLETKRASVSNIAPTRNNSCPDLGRDGILTVSHIAQPGGFRRHHMEVDRGVKVFHKPSLLSQLLDPRYTMHYFQKGIKDSEDAETPRAPERGASSAVTILVLVKTFLTGTLLVLPAGFNIAGLLGGCLILCAIGIVEVYCMLLLVRCREAVGSGSYGDLARVLGRYGPTMLQVMLVTSQYGFVCAEQIYVADNAAKFLDPYMPWLQQWHLLLFFQIFLVPMSWVRKLKFFALTNLLGDGIIIGCVMYLFSFGLSKYSDEGMGAGVALWEPPSGSIMFFGTCVYVYEGINMVLPIYEAHEDKKGFGKLLVGVLSTLTVVFVCFGCVWYCAFGSSVGGVATLNLPDGTLGAQLVPALYSIACLFTTPVLFFPIAQVIEPYIFPLDRWLDDFQRKWCKNCFRTLLMLVSAIIAALGGGQLQNFLAIIGALCCGPLAIVLPAAMHLKICYPNFLAKTLDVVLIIFGSFVTIFSTGIAVMSWHN